MQNNNKCTVILAVELTENQRKRIRSRKDHGCVHDCDKCKEYSAAQAEKHARRGGSISV
jgi:hypothetical protein